VTSPTIDLFGPSTHQGAPQITPDAVNAQVNAAMAQLLPLSGGTLTGIARLQDDGLGSGGTIRSTRNITLTVPTAKDVNQPFNLQTTFGGTNLDSPVAASPLYATRVLNTFNNFNTGQLGARVCFADQRRAAVCRGQLQRSDRHSKPNCAACAWDSFVGD